jgi:hypothetical protein
VLLRLFHDFDQTPSLGLAQGACFHDAYRIADTRFVLFVMSYQA